MSSPFQTRLLCAASLALFLLTNAYAADDPLAATLARMDSAAAAFKNLTAEVRRVSHTAVINEDTVDAGTLYVEKAKPNDFRMRLDFQPPNPKQVEFSGHTARVYYPKNNNVEEYDLAKYKGLVDQFLLLGFGSGSRDLEKVYDIRLGGADTIVGQKTVRLELTPKSKETLQHLKKVDLWISDATGVAVQQKLDQSGGDYMLATYTNMKLNDKLPDSIFRLNLPKDVRRERPQK